MTLKCECLSTKTVKLGLSGTFWSTLFIVQNLKYIPFDYPTPVRLQGFFKNIPTQQYWTNIEYQSMHIHSYNKYGLTFLCSSQYDMHAFWNGNGILFQLPPDAQYREESRQMSQRCWISCSSNSNWLKPFLFSGLKKGRTG